MHRCPGQHRIRARDGDRAHVARDPQQLVDSGHRRAGQRALLEIQEPNWRMMHVMMHVCIRPLAADHGFAEQPSYRPSLTQAPAVNVNTDWGLTGAHSPICPSNELTRAGPPRRED